MKIQTTDKINAADGVKALVYGVSGVGKTRLAIHAPVPLVASAEKGLLSLRREKIPYVDISDYASLLDFFRWFAASKEASYIETLFLDSLTEISQVILAEEKRTTKDPRKAYGNMQDSVYSLIRTLRDMPKKNVVVIAQQAITLVQVNEIQAIQKAVPVVPSEKLQAALPYFWDVILHQHQQTISGTTFTAFHTQESPHWTAKDRGGNLEPLEECNLTKLFKKATA